ncbi:hypothetical protein KC19_7G055100 [Ceratodon purpureus]|uniref:Uncharacterized protein n=1 Tax=Ceratodon purpureus TaxID=3225 RepID=A0A8T0H7Y1_CERPU|nr:hypothetical protein KC19_7G055100 [Ceratodon purpureus]
MSHLIQRGFYYHQIQTPLWQRNLNEKPLNNEIS